MNLSSSSYTSYFRFAQGSWNDLGSEQPTKYRDIFVEHSNSDSGFTLACNGTDGDGIQCYVGCSCNRNNGWYESAANARNAAGVAADADVVEVKSNRGYAYYTNSAGSVVADNSGSGQTQTCYKAQKQENDYFCIEYKYMCDGSECDDYIVDQAISNYNFVLDEGNVADIEDGVVERISTERGKRYCFKLNEERTGQPITIEPRLDNYFYVPITLKIDEFNEDKDSVWVNNQQQYQFTLGSDADPDDGDWEGIPRINNIPTITLNVDVVVNGVCKPVSENQPKTRCVFAKVRCRNIDIYVEPHENQSDLVWDKINICLDSTHTTIEGIEGGDQWSAYAETTSLEDFFTNHADAPLTEENEKLIYQDVYNQNKNFFKELEGQLVQNGGDMVLYYNCNLDKAEGTAIVAPNREGLARDTYQQNKNDYTPRYQAYAFEGIERKEFTAAENANCFFDAGEVYPYCKLRMAIYQEGSRKAYSYGGNSNMRWDYTDIHIHPVAVCGRSAFPKGLKIYGLSTIDTKYGDCHCLAHTGEGYCNTWSGETIRTHNFASYGVDISYVPGCLSEVIRLSDYPQSYLPLENTLGSNEGRYLCGGDMSHMQYGSDSTVCYAPDVLEPPLSTPRIYGSFAGTKLISGLVTGTEKIVNEITGKEYTPIMLFSFYTVY